MFQIGWIPVGPARWIANGKSLVVDGPNFVKAQILGQAQKDLERSWWRSAARHPNSTGLGEGALLHPARRAKADLIKEGLYDAAKAVDLLVCGAIFDPATLEATDVRNEHFCVRCQHRVLATRRHELIECDGNFAIDHEYVRSTHWISQKAAVEWDSWQCLYARGIVPESWLVRPDNVEFLDVKMWASTNFEEALNTSGIAWTDGSGGPKKVPRDIAQVAFGAVSFTLTPTGPASFALSHMACLGGQVPGRQTVPRAEL